MTYNRCMKHKLSYLLGGLIGGLIGFLIGYAFFYLVWVIFKRISPEQSFIAKTLLDENYFVIAFLVLLVFPIEKILKSHKDRHQSHLNKLAEIEWIEQYGNDGRVR
jgi:hypothetical protein